MIISDLNYMEAAAEVASLSGGVRRTLGFSVQINKALVLQNAQSSAKAVAYYGDATAISISTNASIIDQDIS